LKWTGFEVFGVSKLDGSLTKKVRFEGTVIDESGNTIPLIIDIIVGHMTLGYTTVEDTNLQIDQFLLGENTAYAPSISQGIKKPISEIPENPLGLVEVVGNPDAIAKIGDVVAVTFKMKVEGNNSYVPGSNQGDEWYMVIQLGHETLLPGIGKAVVGMRVGETKNVTLSPEDAYGSADEHPLGGKSVRIENLTLVTITQAQ